jgi:NAD+ diphosphatase
VDDGRVTDAVQPDADALAFAFVEGRLLVLEGYEVPAVRALGAAPRLTAGPIPLGQLDGRSCYALSLEEEAAIDGGLRPVGLRELFARVEDAPLVSMVARASQTIEWWVSHAYCGRCGQPTTPP